MKVKCGAIAVLWVFSLVCGLAWPSGALAADEIVLSIGTLGAGSSGYNQTSALAEGLQSSSRFKVRLIPTGNGINRVTQLLNKKINYFVGYDEVYLSLEGMAEFAINKIGPVELRTVMGNTMGLTMVTSETSGIKRPADMKGKKIPYIPGDSSVGYKTSGLIAFAGLSWDDVTPVPYPAWVESVKGLIAGSCDAAQQAIPPSSVIYELAASPRGVYYPLYPHDDEAGWARLREWAPWCFPYKIKASDLVGMEGDEMLEVVGYISPSLVTLASTSAEEVYELVKTLDETYGVYKDSLPEMKGWALEKAALPPLSAPVHEGVVKYLKEKGLWQDEHERWNQELVERNRKLIELWKTVLEESKSQQGDFEEFWVARKKETVGGFSSVLPAFLKK